MPRRAPTALLKDRAEEAERRVLELQAQLEQAQSDSASATASAAEALASVEDMRARIDALNSSSGGPAGNGGSGISNSSTARRHGRFVQLDFPAGVDAHTPDGSITQPPGSGRKGYNLMNEMGLSKEHKAFYNRIRLIIGRNVTKAQLDKRAPWPKQDINKLSKVFMLSKAQVPFLRRFAADWATAEIVRIQLKNRRSYAKRVNLPEEVDNQGDVSVNDRGGFSVDDDGEVPMDDDSEDEDMEE